jgi:tryptophan-rich sensory protein
LKIDWKKLAVCVAIPLAVGGISAYLTMGSMEQFSSLNQPPLSPPPVLFPIVWTILYTLMGIASYIVYTSGCSGRSVALKVYGVQLVFNIIWPLIFFNMRMYLFAFVWLIVLLLLVIITAILFYSCKKLAGYLFIPYILWLVFAGYLNIAIYILN